jgi:hypothetical protein
MQTFTVGSDAVVHVPFLNSNGDPVTPSAASYQVLDMNDAQVVAPTAIGDVSGTDAVVTVPTTSLVPGGYTIRLTMTVGSQSISHEELFGVIAVNRLTYLKNTFQTYANAVFVSRDIPNMVYWLGASRDDQTLALIEAFNRLSRFNYWIPWPEIVDMQNRIAPNWVSTLNANMWPLITPENYASYPIEFRTALNRAQVAEANAVLQGGDDGYSVRRRAGLMSEKVGESSIMFHAGPRPLDLGVSRQALDFLTQYLNNRLSLTRS